MHKFMEIAIKEARDGIKRGHGGPFGSVIVKDNKVIASNHNRVLEKNDSTAHGEIMAIRKAEKILNSYDLSGCILYTTGEPCPMCLCACKWANISKVYYGCTIKDNEIIGFRDKEFDNLFGGRENFANYLECIEREECLKLFKKYNDMKKTIY